MTFPRTYLFAPAHDDERVASALDTAADVVLVDLEDGVPAEHKEAARSRLPAIVDGAGGRPIHVRINGDDGYVGDDLRAAVRRGVSGLRLPKVSQVDHVVELLAAVDSLEAAAHIPAGSIEVFLTIESAGAVSRAASLASAGRPRGGRLVFGAGDLRRDLGHGALLGDGEPTLTARSLLVLASAEANVEPPCDGFSFEAANDIEQLAAATRWSRSLGFIGKSVATQHHVDVVHAVYARTTT